MKDEVRKVIESRNLSIVYQPIVDLRSAEVIGCEALTRVSDAPKFPNPVDLFDAADDSGQLWELEDLTRRLAIAPVCDWPENMHLFINNSPQVFNNPDFPRVMQQAVRDLGGIDPARVVLEITERAGQVQPGDVGVRAFALREAGFQVAIDDVGAGISGLNQIMAMRPNWIKLDRELVSNIDEDPFKQNLIRFLVQFTRLSHVGLVAEGIERREELATLIRMGVTHGQGFYLARPGPMRDRIDDEVRDTILSLAQDVEAKRFITPATVRVSSLAEPIASFDINDTVSLMNARLATMPTSCGAVIVNGRRYVGWIDRATLATLELRGAAERCASELTLNPATVVGSDVTLAEAMEIAASRPEELMPLPLIVQEHGKVAGVVRLSRLLAAAAEAGRSTTAHVAPLTGLPNRVQADHWLKQHIRAGDPSDIAFIDLRDFDAYNVAYGFEMGDAMLLRLVGIIQAAYMDDRNRHFLAHIGEDRFLVAAPGDHRPRLQAVIRNFESEHSAFFSPVDLAAGAFSSVDTAGRSRTFPLTTVRVVYLPAAMLQVREARELFHIATRLRARSRENFNPSVNEIIEERRDALNSQREIA